MPGIWAEDGLAPSFSYFFYRKNAGAAMIPYCLTYWLSTYQSSLSYIWSPIRSFFLLFWGSSSTMLPPPRSLLMLLLSCYCCCCCCCCYCYCYCYCYCLLLLIDFALAFGYNVRMSAAEWINRINQSLHDVTFWHLTLSYPSLSSWFEILYEGNSNMCI